MRHINWARSRVGLDNLGECPRDNSNVDGTQHGHVIGMKENFEGRIRNVSLSSSTPGNALVPVFEAISNSLFAIHAQFGDDDAKRDGKISVLVERGDDDRIYLSPRLINPRFRRR
jgi:hypothetical protein